MKAPMSYIVGRPVPLPIKLAVSLLILIALGALSLLTPGVASRPLTFQEALFTSVSALTVTGLSTLSIGGLFSPMGQLVLALLTQIGGIGYTVLAISALSALGRRIALADRLAVQSSLGFASQEGVFQLIRRVLVLVLGLEAVGALLLAVAWRDLVPMQDLARFAVFHSVGAFCNAGFDLFNGNPQYPNGFPTDGATLWTKGVLAALGAIGMPVLFDLVNYHRRRKLTLHSRLTLRVAGFLYAFGTVTLFISERYTGGVLASESWFRSAGLALSQSVFARTAGFAGLPDFANLSDASQISLIGLMFIGGSPASMGGGITTGTFAVLTIAVYSTVRNRAEAEFLGRRISEATIRKAGSILLVSVIVVVTNTWLLLLGGDLHLNEAFFEIVSAFATCGLSLNVTQRLSGFEQAIVMFTMIWGRLGALTALVALTANRRTQRVRFPEEKVLIG